MLLPITVIDGDGDDLPARDRLDEAVRLGAATFERFQRVKRESRTTAQSPALCSSYCQACATLLLMAVNVRLGGRERNLSCSASE